VFRVESEKLKVRSWKLEVRCLGDLERIYDGRQIHIDFEGGKEMGYSLKIENKLYHSTRNKFREDGILLEEERIETDPELKKEITRCIGIRAYSLAANRHAFVRSPRHCDLSTIQLFSGTNRHYQLACKRFTPSGITRHLSIPSPMLAHTLCLS